jgi:hypothetical protein
MTEEKQLSVIEPKEVQTQEQGFLAMMERLAMSNIDVSMLEKMMELHERTLNRNAKQSYMSAFAQMQPHLPAVIRAGKTNNATYAKFEDIVATIQEVLGQYGFGFSHRVNQTEGKIEVTCILSHRDGHSEETLFIAPADTSGSKNAVQAIGSTVSYGKRYTLNALLGIATKDEDNNGNGAIVDTKKSAEIDTLIRETNSNREKFHKRFCIDNVQHLLMKDYETAKQMLMQKKGGKND